jgi:hypothetical protein
MRRPRPGAILTLVLLLAGTLRTAPLGALGPVNLSRYVVTAPAATVGFGQGIDVARLYEYCADEDGCQLVMQMSNYDAVNEPGVAGSRTGRLSISPVSSSHWRYSGELADPDGIGSVGGTDASGSTESWRVWDCVLTDGEFVNVFTGEIGDFGQGFTLINLSDVEGGSDPDATTECRLTISD